MMKEREALRRIAVWPNRTIYVALLVIYSIFVFGLGGLSVSVANAQSTSIERVSVASDGTQGNGDVWYPSISADGRFVAFMSSANNLVDGDTNGAYDVFVHDRQTGTTTRVSVASDGTQSQGQGNFDIQKPSISADGRFVAFTSSANNLVAEDTNGRPDVFVHDRQTGTTTRVSVASNGDQANSEHAYGSREPSISADGRFVAFTSNGSNLVADDTNGWDDVFVHDLQTGETTLVSIANNGDPSNLNSFLPSISADGHLVAFESGATNLLGPASSMFGENIFVHDRRTGVTTRVSVPSNGDQTYQNKHSFNPSISADGRHVAFLSLESHLVADDTNEVSDIFVHDRQTGMTTRVSVASDGTQGNAWSGSDTPSISADGRYVAFTSYANNLVDNDTNGTEDIFIRDCQTGTTIRVSMASDGTQGNDASYNHSVSSDGQNVAFMSQASNLVANDTNGTRDVFVTNPQFAPPPPPSVTAPLHDEQGLIMTTSEHSTFTSYSYFLDYGKTLNHDGSDLALTSDGSLTYSQATVGKDVHAICDGTVLDVRCDGKSLLGTEKSMTCKKPDLTWMKVLHPNCGGRNLIAYYGHIESVPANFTKKQPDQIYSDDVIGKVMQYTKRSGHLHLTLDTDTERDLTRKKYEMCDYVYDYDASYPGCSSGKCITSLSNCAPSHAGIKPSKGQILLGVGWGRVFYERYINDSNKISTAPLYINPNAMRNLGFIDLFDIYRTYALTTGWNCGLRFSM